MDADCLIKLAKSSLKEIVCRSFSVVIPPLVKKEVVDDSVQPDSMMVKNNLDKKILTVSPASRSGSKGEEAVFDVFRSGKYDAICSDDKRFIKRLRLFEIPYLTPAVLIALMVRKGDITLSLALGKLELLAPLVSDDEYLTVKAFLVNWRLP